MTLFRSTRLAGSQTPIEGAGVTLRFPASGDYEAWASLRAASRDFLTPWEPTWPENDLTRQAFRQRLRRYGEEARQDSAYSYFIFAGTNLAGGLTLSNVRRGVAMTAALGYWMGVSFAGRGLMTAALHALFPHVYGTLGLHRIEAATMPHNQASIRLLEKVGFQREGYARKYLCIAGTWQDHVLFARLGAGS